MTEHGMVSHNTAQQNKLQTIPSAGKTMGTAFWNAEGCILVKFMPHSEIINAAHCLYTIQKLQHALCDKCPGKENITLQQVNAGSHTADVCMNIMKKNGWELLPTSSYGPDLAPLDYYLFGLILENMQIQQYATNETVQ